LFSDKARATGGLLSAMASSYAWKLMSKVSKISAAPLMPADLYDRDYYTWTQEQARALREHRMEEVDWPNVAEEIEDWARAKDEHSEAD
jgi:uncharacterized protein DUF29